MGVKMIALIGDIHGEFDILNALLRKLPPEAVVIQVGDYGLWPEPALSVADAVANYMPPRRPDPCRPVYWIDGNHEWAPLTRGVTAVTEVARNSWFIPRGTVLQLDNRIIGFLGGADSVDKQWRRPEVSWFSDERIMHSEAHRLLENAKGHLDLLVTHTPPACIVEAMLKRQGAPVYEEFQASARTVEQVWDSLGRPPLVCGHMHESFESLGVRVLDINEVMLLL
jgi:hypothetical protein